MTARTSPVVMTVAEVAKALDMSEPTVRRAIQRDMEDGLDDPKRRIPGGRMVNTRYWIYREIFERVTSGADLHPMPFVLHRKAA